MSFRNSRVLSSLLKNKNFICYPTTLKQYSKSQPHIFTKCENNSIFQCEKFSQSSDTPPKCWQCNFPHKSDLFCSKCKALQKLPQDLDYFDIIGIEKSFNVSKQELQKKYRQLQVLLHPDKYGQKSDEEKKISEEFSSLVNKAYTTLLHPLNRGLYLLKLYNISISEDTSSSDPKFLMEIMEKNEEVEEAFQSKEKTLELLKDNQKTLDSLVKQLSQAFSEKDHEKAKVLLIKMKFYTSIDNRLQKLKQELGIVE